MTPVFRNSRVSPLKSPKNLLFFEMEGPAVELYGYRSILPLSRRIWAFEQEDLQDILKDYKNDYQFKLSSDRIPPSMKDVPEYFYPANHDVPRFFDIFLQFTHAYLDIIYLGSNQRMLDDAMLSACLDELAGRLKLDRDKDFGSMEKVAGVFASLFCTVTGFHEHVGHVSDYFWHPGLVGATIRPGKDMDSIQTYMNLVALVASTGVRVPALLGCWKHLLQRDSFSTQTVPL